MDVTEILSRLEKVRPAGRGRWTACCPAHRDRTPSLAIRELDDGRILLHDFGGCDTSAVLDALGVEIGDLFAQPLYHRAKRVSQPFTAQDALRCLNREVGIVTLIAAELTEGMELKPDDKARLALASDRIEEAANYVAGL